MSGASEWLDAKTGTERWHKEIADVLECPEGTVMSRLFHARKQMQELLREFADLDHNKEAANARRG